MLQLIKPIPIFLASVSLLAPSLSLAATNVMHTEDQSQAFFSKVSGCEDVVVGVSVVEPERSNTSVSPTTTDAFVFGVFNNICDIGSSYSFADVVTLDQNEFTQKGLRGAELDFVRNIGGFEVRANLHWDGIGKADRNKNRIHLKNDGIIVHDADVIANRAATIGGTFAVNGINYADGTPTGGLSEISAHTVTIQK